MRTEPEHVVSNRSPLLYLHQIRRLDLLPSLYQTVIVPQAVVAELKVGERMGVDVPILQKEDWVVVGGADVTPIEEKIADLGAGESQAISIALEFPKALLIIDDGAGRQLAGDLGLRFTGTLGVLIRAKRIGLLPTLRVEFEKLSQTSMWLSSRVLQEVLRQQGEI